MRWLKWLRYDANPLKTFSKPFTRKSLLWLKYPTLMVMFESPSPHIWEAFELKLCEKDKILILLCWFEKIPLASFQGHRGHKVKISSNKKLKAVYLVTLKILLKIDSLISVTSKVASKLQWPQKNLLHFFKHYIFEIRAKREALKWAIAWLYQMFEFSSINQYKVAQL